MFRDLTLHNVCALRSVFRNHNVREGRRQKPRSKTKRTMNCFVEKRRSRFSFTPGFGRVCESGQEQGKPCKTVSRLSSAQFTWLKPGVNATGFGLKENSM